MRFNGLTVGINDGKHWTAMGPALGFFGYLVSRQTDPHGNVNYGRPLPYAQMATEIPNCPPERTLQRWMATLRRAGYVLTHRVKYEGNIFRIRNPKKWCRQRRLPLEMPLEKPVKSARNGRYQDAPEVAGRKTPEVASQKHLEERAEESTEQTETYGQPFLVENSNGGEPDAARRVRVEATDYPEAIQRLRGMINGRVKAIPNQVLPSDAELERRRQKMGIDFRNWLNDRGPNGGYYTAGEGRERELREQELQKKREQYVREVVSA